jgi:hypothetical protein
MLWLGWDAYWIVAARHTMTNRRTESLLTGASYRVLLALGVILLASPGYHLSLANFFLCPQSAFTLAIGLCLKVCGLSIAVCARHHLGKYWSDRITLKADHRVIQSGPTHSCRIRSIAAFFWLCPAGSSASAQSRAVLGSQSSRLLCPQADTRRAVAMRPSRRGAV